MTLQDRYLYHQIHPQVDHGCSGGFGSLYPLWHHHLALALVVMLVPPLLASCFLMAFGNLEPYRHSAFGRYIARSMSHAMEAARLGGMIVVAFGAWERSPWMILAGCVVVLFAWLRGTLGKHDHPA
jgi:hypothetical protein